MRHILSNHLDVAFPYVFQRPRGPTLKHRSCSLSGCILLQIRRCVDQAVKARAGQRRRVCESHHCLESGKDAGLVRQKSVVACLEVQSPACQQHMRQTRLREEPGHARTDCEIDSLRGKNKSMTSARFDVKALRKAKQAFASSFWSSFASTCMI